jgi:glycosyltransferase involved in cell wall biosynthesis
MNNLRVLYSSNAIWSNSGYGIQGRSLLPRLAGLETVGGRSNIAQFAWYGLQGGNHNVEGFTIFPAGVDPYGNDIIQSHARAFNANVVISLIDAWVMQNTGKKVAPALWLPWLPIDHTPVPERVLESIADAYLPLTYAKWGKQMLDACGVKNYYIPHGIEPNIYKILEQSQVDEFKQNYLKHKGHLTIMVAANKGYPDRKAFQVQLRAWSNFAKDKANVKLYIHTEPTPMYGGLNLVKLYQQLGISDKVMFPERYEYFTGFPPEYLAFIYNSANILMGASMSEGFGIPLIEAQACGTPVITSNFSSMPELVRYGNIIDPIDMIYTPLEAWQCWPDHKGIKEALEENYQDWEENKFSKNIDEGTRASEKIHGEYSWDTITLDYWKPLFEHLHTKIFPNQQNILTVKSGKVTPIDQ